MGDINLKDLDDISTDDDDDDSSDDEPTGLGAFMSREKKKYNDVTQFDGFDDGDEGTIVQKMKGILALRHSLGIDQDIQFLKEQEEKEAEKRKLASMTVEERMKYEESKAGDVMSKIRERHAARQRELEAERKAKGLDVEDDGKKKKKKKKGGEEEEVGEEDEKALKLIKKLKKKELGEKKLSKKKLLDEEGEDGNEEGGVKKKKGKKKAALGEDDEEHEEGEKKKKKKSALDGDALPKKKKGIKAKTTDDSEIGKKKPAGPRKARRASIAVTSLKATKKKGPAEV